LGNLSSSAASDEDTAFPDGPKHSVLPHLREKWISFDPSERLIARYVLKNPEVVIHLPFAQMLQNTGTCSAALCRFYRNLGFKGYPAFKIALARELGQSNPNASGRSWLKRLFVAHRRRLASASQLNSPVIIRRASKAISRANRVELFAAEASFSTAYLACCHFKALGLSASVGLTSGAQLWAAGRLGSGDAALGISLEETAPNTARCLELAHQNRAAVIWLSSALDPQPRGGADIIFCTRWIGAEPAEFPFASLLVQWTTIDALLVALADDLTPDGGGN
jgi:DNA-binding MurR/RpiR family transcriptional regulator